MRITTTPPPGKPWFRTLGIAVLAALSVGCGQNGGQNGGPAGKSIQEVGNPLVAAMARYGNRLPQSLKSLDISFQLDDDGQLVSAYLTIPGIGDADVKTLADATKLRNLSLAGTSVTDDCCDVLGQLPQLESLDLSGTRITTQGVRKLQSLRRLKIINLQDTVVTDEAMQVVAGWAKLADLNLAGTKVTDVGLVLLKGMPALQFLNVKQTAVTTDGIRQLERELGALRQVQMDRPVGPSSKSAVASTGDNSASVRRKAKSAPNSTPTNNRRESGVKPRAQPVISAGKWEIRNRDQLVQRMMSTDSLVANGLVSLYRLPGKVPDAIGSGLLNDTLVNYCRQRQFSQVDMSGGRLEAAWLCFGPRGGANVDMAGLQRLALVPELHLDMTEMVLRAEHLDALKELRNLHSLRLCRTNVGDQSLAWIDQITTLRELSLTATPISDGVLENLSKLPDLQRLWLSETAISDAGMQVLGKMVSLRELDLSSTAISDVGLAELEKLTSLRSINLNNTDVSDDGVSLFREQHPQCLIGYLRDRPAPQVANH